MATPSQGLIRCKNCGAEAQAHKVSRLFCDVCAKAKQVEYQRQYRAREKAKPRVVTCKSCGKQFSTQETGRTWKCKACMSAYLREYAATRRARIAEYARNYRARLGDVYRKQSAKRRADQIAKMTQEELVKFRRQEADKSRRLNEQLRKQIFEHYGTKCSCCGESQPEFLSIDHIENNGAEMRRNKTHGRGGSQFYQWLRKNNFPVGFQTLCMNCNVGKHRNGGACPHSQTRRND